MSGIVEYGLIHVFLGNYNEGMNLCIQASKLQSNASLVQGCIGLAGMYILDTVDQTIHAFQYALQLKKHEAYIINQYLHTHSNQNLSNITAEIENNAGIMSSPVFSLPVLALENNLLTSFRIHKRYKQCVDWCIENNQLPSYTHGAAVILAFATVNWSYSLIY